VFQNHDSALSPNFLSSLGWGAVIVYVVPVHLAPGLISRTTRSTASSRTPVPGYARCAATVYQRSLSSYDQGSLD